MKNTILLFVILTITTLLFSCKKNYTCECTGNLFGDVLTIRATKKNAQKQCDQFEKEGKYFYSDNGCVLTQK
jgi:hypothetical protein